MFRLIFLVILSLINIDDVIGGNYGMTGSQAFAATPQTQPQPQQQRTSYGGGAMGFSTMARPMAAPITMTTTQTMAAPVSLAVRSQQNVQFFDIPSVQTHAQPYQVMVESQAAPMTMTFRTFSSPMNVRHQHMQSQGSVQETQSEDAPHVLRHTVHKPILQEIREVIAPMRTIRQEVRPVEETIQTFVARGQAMQSHNHGYAQQSTIAAPQPSNIVSVGHPLAPGTGGIIGANGFAAPIIGFTTPTQPTSFIPMSTPASGGFIGSVNFPSNNNNPVSFAGGTGGRYGAMPSFAGFAAAATPTPTTTAAVAAPTQQQFQLPAFAFAAPITGFAAPNIVPNAAAAMAASGAGY